MAKPRVFVSSTFYDLRQLRSDLDRFVREVGYEPVLHERGSIPYGSQDRLEEYAYKEIDLCDILVAIIGGRFGSTSSDGRYSIAQRELKRALELGRQVFIYVERGVAGEYETWLQNKALEGVRYSHVDDVRVYKFLEEVHALPVNNQIADFETAGQIVDHLRAQWAGLFHRFLGEQRRVQEINVVESLTSTSQMLSQLVNYLVEERKNKDHAIRDILLFNHPLFQHLRKLTATPYRLFFTSRNEMAIWLRARGWTSDTFGATFDSDAWKLTDKNNGVVRSLRISDDLFDGGGRLKTLSPEEWNPKLVDITETPIQEKEDDLPF